MPRSPAHYGIYRVPLERLSDDVVIIRAVLGLSIVESTAEKQRYVDEHIAVVRLGPRSEGKLSSCQ